MSPEIMQPLAIFGGLCLLVLFASLIAWLSLWMPERASKDYVYQKLNSQRTELVDWLMRHEKEINKANRLLAEIALKEKP